MDSRLRGNDGELGEILASTRRGMRRLPFDIGHLGAGEQRRIEKNKGVKSFQAVEKLLLKKNIFYDLIMVERE